MTRQEDRRHDPAGVPEATPSPSPERSLASSASLLRRLATEDGDPLGVASRCAQRRWAAALLVDSSRLYAQTLLRISHASASAGPPPWADGWLEHQIDNALTDLLIKDQEDERGGIIDRDATHSPHAFMMHWFGIEAGLARTAAVRFNGLPERTRHIFFALILDRRTVTDCDSLGLGSRSTIHTALQHAFRALFLLPALAGGALGEIDS